MILLTFSTVSIIFRFSGSAVGRMFSIIPSVCIFAVGAMTACHTAACHESSGYDSCSLCTSHRALQVNYSFMSRDFPFDFYFVKPSFNSQK
jgi:hypothetical protein